MLIYVFQVVRLRL